LSTSRKAAKAKRAHAKRNQTKKKVVQEEPSDNEADVKEENIEPPPHPEPKAVISTPALSVEPKCAKCGCDMDVLRAQLTSKVAGLWKCSKCNTRTVQLHRIFGSWPIAQFKGLSEEDKLNFMKEIGKAGSIEEIKNAAINSLTKMKISSFVAKKEGTYLPLSVYEKNGWDVELIKATCPKKLHEDLKIPVYKVSLETDAEKTIEQQIRKELIEMTEAGPTSKRDRTSAPRGSTDPCPEETPPPPPAPPAPPEHVVARAEAKRVAKVRVDANKTVHKMSGVFFLLGEALKNKRLDKVPAYVQDDAKETYATIDAMLKEAKKKTADRAPADLSFTLKEVEGQCKRAASVQKLLNDMLAAAVAYSSKTNGGKKK